MDWTTDNIPTADLGILGVIAAFVIGGIFIYIWYRSAIKDNDQPNKKHES